MKTIISTKPPTILLKRGKRGGEGETALAGCTVFSFSFIVKMNNRLLLHLSGKTIAEMKSDQVYNVLFHPTDSKIGEKNEKVKYFKEFRSPSEAFCELPPPDRKLSGAFSTYST